MINELFNTRLICPQCIQERKLEFQKLIETGAVQLADISYIKTLFISDDGFNEHMWVKVTSINNNMVTGILDNDPTYTFKNLKFGDEVSFPLSEGWEGFSEVMEV